MPVNISYASSPVRVVYVPIGRVDWRRFVPLAVVALLACLVPAMGIYFAFTAGWYYVFATPLLLGLPIMWVVQWVVHDGRCRSPGLALAFGCAAGAVVYLGSYDVGMVAVGGTRLIGRPDLLPRYVELRMETDTQTDSRTPNGQPLPPASPVMNWAMFSMELAMLLFVGGWTAFRRARRAYCESCDRWQDQSYLLLPPGMGKTVAAWAVDGELHRLGTEPAIHEGHARRFTTILFERCPGDIGATDACPSHVSVKDVGTGGTLTTFQMFDGNGGRVRINRLVLTGPNRDAAAEMLRQPHRLHPGVLGRRAR